MKLHELSFGKIIILKNNLAEIIINEGVEMDSEMSEELHNALIANMKAPFSIVVNKINRYSYDFETQMKLGSIGELEAIAVVAYDRISIISTESVASLPKKIKWNIKLFSNRDEAISWAMSEIQ